MSFRTEIKFITLASGNEMMRAHLLSLGAKQIHAERKITSQYFDTKTYLSHLLSEEGVIPRKKIRVRWYNDSMADLKLERKYSSQEGRFKTTQDLEHTKFNSILRGEHFEPDFGLIFPSARVEYMRTYYQFNDLRITFDKNIFYHCNLTKRNLPDEKCVVEVKAKEGFNPDNLFDIISIIPSRFSKYSRAILKLGLA